MRGRQRLGVAVRLHTVGVGGGGEGGRGRQTERQAGMQIEKNC